MITAQEHLLRSRDGSTEIFVRVWRAANATGTVLLVHGHGEHSGRYDYVAGRFNAQGWTVVAPDLRGHGRTSGVRGHVIAWDAYSDDLQVCLEKCGEPGKPVAVVGHSMGGLIAIHYALKHQANLRGLVLSSPLLQLAFPVPPLKAFVGNWFSKLIPSLALSTGLDSKAVCRDLAIVKAYETDPLVHDKASTRWFTEMQLAMAQAHSRAGEFKLPVLVFHGGGDQLTNPNGSRIFFKGLTTEKRAFKEWPGLFHEIFNEPEKEQVLDEVVAWLRPLLA